MNAKKVEKKKISVKKKNQIVVECLPLIRFIAKKISMRLPANIELEDLISSGVIGLMDAVDKYDSNRDNKFKTYAEFRIRGAILDELRSQDWVPRSIRDKAKLLEKANIELESKLGRLPKDEEIAQRLNLNMEEYFLFLNQVRSVNLVSIDETQKFSITDKKQLFEVLQKGNTPFKNMSIHSLKRIIHKSIEELPERQRMLITLYYYEDLKLKQIGTILNVTESRVSQLHAQAISRLKIKLNHFANNTDDKELLSA